MRVQNGIDLDLLTNLVGPDPQVERMTRNLIEAAGETIDVRLTVKGVTRGWKVSRHFIALHGIKGETLPEVAEKYGFEKLP